MPFTKSQGLSIGGQDWADAFWVINRPKAIQKEINKVFIVHVLIKKIGSKKMASQNRMYVETRYDNMIIELWMLNVQMYLVDE